MQAYNLAYIVATPRSGSTLLDNIIASHPDAISLGEAHQLRAYALDDRRFYDPKQPLVCTCGAKVQSCSFWSAVQRKLGAALDGLVLQSPLSREVRDTLPRHRQIILWAPAKAVLRWPSIYRIAAVQRLFDGERIGFDSFRLFDAVHKVTGAQCIVDSSKSPFRLLSLYRQRPSQVKVVMLCRDYKAVTHSRMKRGRNLSAAIAMWVKWQREIEALSRDMEPSNIFRLTYEQLCAAPDATMQRLWKFLMLTPSETVERQSVEVMHHLGGSPSKRDNNKREIRLDTAYLHAFSASELSRLKQLARPYAQQWGYD